MVGSRPVQEGPKVTLVGETWKTGPVRVAGRVGGAVRAILLGCAAWCCTATPPAQRPGAGIDWRARVVPSRPRCDLADPRAVHAYMMGARRRIFERWKLPEGRPIEASVVVRFSLAVSGEISAVEIVDGRPDPDVERSIREALSSSSPLPRLDPGLECLASEPLVGKFATRVELRVE
jgi:hypothetical protein